MMKAEKSTAQAGSGRKKFILNANNNEQEYIKKKNFEKKWKF